MTIRLATCALAIFFISYSTLYAVEPVRVVSEEFASNPRQPQAAVDEEGTIYIAFGAGGAIYCCKSTDAGK